MEKKKDNKIINTTTTGLSQNEIIQTYGEANSQYIQAYKGIRVDKYGDAKEYAGRSLKEISEYKVNPDYKDANLKQQAGFSAEEIQVARKNQQNIIKGDETRVSTTDGLGDTNNTQYDHVTLDKTGNVIEGSGTQMKFLKVKVDPKTGEKSYNVIDKLANDKRWDRYDTDITIPKEDYEGAKAYAQKKYESNMELSKKAAEKGNTEAAAKYKRRAEDYKKAGERVKPSEVTQEEAMDARLNPETFTAKKVLKGAHEAGKVAAKSTFVVAGAISVGQNLYAVFSGEKDCVEATKDVMVTTGKAVATGYVAGAAGSTIKSLMHTSSSAIVRRLGTTTTPGMIVTGAIEIGESLTKYAKGDIDTTELFEELGEKGVGMMAAGYSGASGAMIGATIGSVVPGVGTVIGGVVGGFIGTMLGYNISGVIYKQAMNTIHREKIAEERRRMIEKIAEEAIRENERYKKMFIEFSKNQLATRQCQIEHFLSEVNEGIFNNDMDRFISSINTMGAAFGYDLQFKNMEEFDEFMLDEDSVLEL
ncbi:hypothetical protein IX317_001169 [Fusobacterium sp. DD29]|uniref:hypothetical protein n=1 Tax=unclassified Fusobacterium TaxID=2648384 RepID=UPI001B8CDDEA|nr:MULTISPECIES: hypothetical protein [unclassified Fusobacterium]MBR8749495.1 hypothetical protein [Fusobacterium sp. DD29]MBR8761756.1 hypothetical protein [Fusobacterium sp. DD25]MBR8767774.1 hypothetical protein [Fusobacterium sp. DD43]MBR8771805.1 hypothetical protein [Fusobacterium sp. DD40]MBR8776050.1 hypothetical protein [Fusobacterium sp. DD17]